MSDREIESEFVEDYHNEEKQCWNCAHFQSKDGKAVCISDDLSFEEALEQFGEIPLTGHCNFFKSLD